MENTVNYNLQLPGDNELADIKVLNNNFVKIDELFKEMATPTIATQAEAEAGTDNTKLMTPLRTSQYLKKQIVNDLTTGGTNKVLSAEQGKVLFQSVSDGKTLVAGAITDKGITTSPGDTFQKMATNISLIETKSILTGNATVDKVLQGSTFYKDNADIKLTGEMPNNGTISNTITTQGGQFNIPKGYTKGGSVKAQFANLQPGNIRQGINIGGVVGNLVIPPPITDIKRTPGMVSGDVGYKKTFYMSSNKQVLIIADGRDWGYAIRGVGFTTDSSNAAYSFSGGQTSITVTLKKDIGQVFTLFEL